MLTIRDDMRLWLFHADLPSPTSNLAHCLFVLATSGPAHQHLSLDGSTQEGIAALQQRRGANPDSKAGREGLS